jgi:hypothetical protein
MTFATPRDRLLPPKDMLGVLFFCCVMSGLLGAGLQVALHVLLESNLALYYALRTLAVVTLVTTAILGIAWQRARTVSGIDRTALALIAFVAAGRMWPLVTTGPTRDALAILAEILLPMALMIWFQWGLLRRNWRHRKGA